MKTVDFLDAVKAKYRLTSDYQLAKKLGWGASRISQYRISSRELDDDACLQVAQLLEMPAPYVMACIAAARAKSTEARRAWERAAKMLKSGTAAAILGAALFIAGEKPAGAAEPSAASVYSVKRRHKRQRIDHARPRRRLRRAPSQRPLFPSAPPITAA